MRHRGHLRRNARGDEAPLGMAHDEHAGRIDLRLGKHRLECGRVGFGPAR